MTTQAPPVPNVSSYNPKYFTTTTVGGPTSLVDEAWCYAHLVSYPIAQGPTNLVGITNTGATVLNGNTTINGSITNTSVQPAVTDSSTLVCSTSWVQAAIASQIAKIPSSIPQPKSYQLYVNTTTIDIPNNSTVSIYMVGGGGQSTALLFGPTTDTKGYIYSGGCGGSGGSVYFPPMTLNDNLSTSTNATPTTTGLQMITDGDTITLNYCNTPTSGWITNEFDGMTIASCTAGMHGSVPTNTDPAVPVEGGNAAISKTFWNGTVMTGSPGCAGTVSNGFVLSGSLYGGRNCSTLPYVSTDALMYGTGGGMKFNSDGTVTNLTQVGSALYVFYWY